MKRVAFDLHGVLRPSNSQLKNTVDLGYFIDGYEGARRFFVGYLQDVLKSFRERDIEIWVVSGPPADEVKAELTELGYVKGEHYDHVDSVADYLKDTGVEMWQDEKQTWWASEGNWWSAKAAICAMRRIELLADDKKEYAPYFKGTQCKFHLWEWNKNGKTLDIGLR